MMQILELGAVSMDRTRLHSRNLTAQIDIQYANDTDQQTWVVHETITKGPTFSHISNFNC